jgi:hypothetical protein
MKQKPLHSLQGEKGLQVYNLLVPHLIPVNRSFARTSEVYMIQPPSSMVLSDSDSDSEGLDSLSGASYYFASPNPDVHF